MNSRIARSSKSYQNWACMNPSLKVSVGYLTYPTDIRDAAKSGMGCRDNRHLRYVVESISVNVGGLLAEASSLPRKQVSVGGPIVVRERESRPHGEGGQEFNILQVESTRSRRNLRRILPRAVIKSKSNGDDKRGGNSPRGMLNSGEPDAVKVARPVRRGGWIRNVPERATRSAPTLRATVLASRPAWPDDPLQRRGAVR